MSDFLFDSWEAASVESVQQVASTMSVHPHVVLVVVIWNKGRSQVARYGMLAKNLAHPHVPVISILLWVWF